MEFVIVALIVGGVFALWFGARRWLAGPNRHPMSGAIGTGILSPNEVRTIYPQGPGARPEPPPARRAHVPPRAMPQPHRTPAMPPVAAARPPAITSFNAADLPRRDSSEIDGLAVSAALLMASMPDSDYTACRREPEPTFSSGRGGDFGGGGASSDWSSSPSQDSSSSYGSDSSSSSDSGSSSSSD
jgi:hypothetical protein